MTTRVNSRQGRTVVLGGLNMDLIADLPRPAGPGETVEGTRFYTTPGGKGGNQAVAAGRLSAPGAVEFVGRVGNDSYGGEMAAYLRAANVGTNYLQTDVGAASGVAIIFIDATGQNYVNAIYGANARCDTMQVRDAATALTGASVLLAQQEIPLDTTFAVMKEAKAKGVTVILDPAPARVQLPDGFLQLADVLTPNQGEAEALTGITVNDAASARRAALEIKRMGVKGVIIKMAESGAYIEMDGMSRHFAPFKVPVVATVGAGDAFNGGLAAGIASGLSLEEAIWLAMATGAMSVTKPGAQESMPSRSEVDRLLRTQRPA
ncbi:MAG: ribokinase [Dehalococcoidia bacterium]|nr:ribokinase [Dehalococcoidia bacterium]MSQ34647.1 ribokinase [Dehalococcoidia bacterium]